MEGYFFNAHHPEQKGNQNRFFKIPFHKQNKNNAEIEL